MRGTIPIDEIIAAGVQCAKDAAKGVAVCVALDVGPTGDLLKPASDFSFDAAYGRLRMT